jgi:hypothetical protein
VKSETNPPDGAPDTRQGPADPSPALPTIIIDPSLGRDSDPAPSRAAAAERAVSGAPDTLNIAPAPPGFDDAQGSFDLAQAERLASSFRPSWELAAPAAQTAAPARVDAPAPQAAATAAAAAIVIDDELPLPQLPGRRNKRRALLLTAGAVGFFAIMLVLALRSSRPELPEGAVPSQAPSPTASPNAVTAVAPAPTPAAAPTPTPEPEPVPVPVPVPVTPPPTEAPAAAAPTPAVAPVPVPVPDAAPPPPAPATVRVRVTTSPAVALLTLDGAPIANPFDAELPRGGKHKLEARAVGHRGLLKTVLFDRDQQLTLELRPEVARRPAPAPRRARATAEPRPSAPPPAPVLTIEKQPAKKTKGAGFVADSPY